MLQKKHWGTWPKGGGIGHTPEEKLCLSVSNSHVKQTFLTFSVQTISCALSNFFSGFFQVISRIMKINHLTACHHFTYSKNPAERSWTVFKCIPWLDKKRGQKYTPTPTLTFQRWRWAVSPDTVFYKKFENVAVKNVKCNKGSMLSLVLALLRSAGSPFHELSSRLHSEPWLDCDPESSDERPLLERIPPGAAKEQTDANISSPGICIFLHGINSTLYYHSNLLPYNLLVSTGSFTLSMTTRYTMSNQPLLLTMCCSYHERFIQCMVDLNCTIPLPRYLISNHILPWETFTLISCTLISCKQKASFNQAVTLKLWWIFCLRIGWLWQYWLLLKTFDDILITTRYLLTNHWLTSTILNLTFITVRYLLTYHWVTPTTLTLNFITMRYLLTNHWLTSTNLTSTKLTLIFITTRYRLTNHWLTSTNLNLTL